MTATTAAKIARKPRRRGGRRRVSTPVRAFRALRRNRTLALAGLLLLATAASWQAGIFGVAAGQVLALAGETAAGAGLVVDNVELAGLERTKRNEVMRALGVDSGDPLLAFDIKAARERIRSLPWVKEAAIARRLPATLAVTIVERRPQALWQLDQALWLIDETGTRITNRGLEEFSRLPLVVGEGAAAAAAPLFALLAEEPVLGARVRAAVRVGERRWDLVFRNGVRLMLPEVGVDYGPRPAWARIARLEREYGLLEREVRVLDMRLDDRLVVRVTPQGRKAIRAGGNKT